MKKMINFSKWSAALAVLCAIHCALMPVALVAAPLVAAEVMESHWMEWAMLGVSFLLGGTALWKGYANEHGKANALWWFAAGLLLMLSAHFFDLHILEHALTFVGAGFWVIAQILNVRYTKSCQCHLPQQA